MALHSKFINNCMQLLFPPVCAVCKKPLDPRLPQNMCHRCAADIKYIRLPVCRICGMELVGSGDRDFLCGDCLNTPPAYFFARSLVYYDSAVKQLVRRLKYGADTSVTDGIADIIRACDLTLFDDCQWIIPVPLHLARHRSRRLNQATILAGLFFPEKKHLIRTDWLMRERDTVPQTTLGGRERRRNLAGAFQVRAGSALFKAKVCLVDDVFTTGTTVGECARTLSSAGVSTVKVVTLARVAVPQRGRLG